MQFHRMQFHCIKVIYSTEPIDRIYVKGYEFLYFSKNMSKNLSHKFGQKLLDSAKKSTTDAIKTAPKRAILKTAEATIDLIDNKIADKITFQKKSSDELKNDEMEAEKKTYFQKGINKLLMN